MTIRRRTQSANSADQNGPVLTPNNWSLIRVRDACQSYPPFDAVSPPFKHGSIRYGRTASAADRAVLVELRRFLAVIHATATPPCGRCPRSTSRRSSSTPRRSRPCSGRSKPWSGRSRSSAGKRHTWPGTTGRSPRRYAGAGADAPAWSRARSWVESLMVLGSESAGGDGAAISHRDGPARRRGDEPPARSSVHDVPLPLGGSEGAQPPASPCRGPAKRGPKG